MKLEMTLQAKKACDIAKKISKTNEHGYVGTEHILLGLVKEGTGVAARILEENGVTYEKLEELIESLVSPGGIAVLEKEGYSPKAESVLVAARDEADKKDEKIGTEHILFAILNETECVATRLLNTLGTNVNKMYTDLLISMGRDPREVRDELMYKNSGQGQMLSMYSRDLTQMAADGELDPVVGREDEISRLILILSRRRKNNPCLTGEAGVGKTAIVEGLAQRISAGLVPDSVAGKRVLTLDLAGMVAGSKYRGEFEERIKRVVSEVTSAGNIILFLDEIHTLIGAGGAEGALDASNILKPSLSRGEIQMIGATTLDEYRKYIEKDAALERRFQPINVEEPSEEETLEILKGLRPKLELHHYVTISDEALKSAVTLSVRYITGRSLPDKAIDLVDEAAARAKLYTNKGAGEAADIRVEINALDAGLELAISEDDLDKAKEIKAKRDSLLARHEAILKRYERRKKKKQIVVDEETVSEVVSNWTKIPVKKLTKTESDRLKSLEKTLHKRVVGQDEAVSAISKAVRRGRVGIKAPNRPTGSFLLLGPTGVGKTEVSKALAEAMFGDEKAIVRVDMSEYMEKHSVSKMIGSPPGYVGYDEGGQLSEKIRKNPYSVILFDEIEKAHPDVFNILLQILDDGRLTDAHGKMIDFKNTIIIMTSNAGASAIMSPKNLGFTPDNSEKASYERMKSNVMEEVKRTFKPEFINRIDEILVFHALTKADMKKIAAIMLDELARRVKDTMSLELKIRPAVKEHIAEKGYDPKYGARPARRAVRDLVEDPLAEKILAGEIKEADTVEVSMKKDKIIFEVKN